MNSRSKLASGREIADRWFRHGRELARAGSYEQALESLEQALSYSVEETDLGYLACVRSWLGLAVAMTGGNLARARVLCEEAVYVRPRDPELYVNLARVLVSSDRRELAMASLDAALALDPGNEASVEIIREFGMRRTPAFRFLERSNLLNKYVGLLRHRFED